VTANENFKSLSGFAGFARASNTSGLTWAWYGGCLIIDGVLTGISGSSLSLTPSGTNYIELDRAGGANAVKCVTGGFTPGRIPLYQVTCNASAITSEVDRRAPFKFAGRASIAVTTADVTLSQAQAACELLEFTGAKTADRSIIVPTLVAIWHVTNSTSDANKLTVKTSAGTGVVVGKGRRVILACDGTNVIRVVDEPIGQDVAYAASITPDAALGHVVVGQLTGNLTINAPTNPAKHQILAFAFAQDGTGSWAITWDSVFRKAADAAGAASEKGATSFIYDGAEWVQLGGALDWA